MISTYNRSHFTPVPPAATSLLSDTFTDTNGVLLGAHSPEAGRAWTVLTGSMEIQSNAVTGGTGTSAAVVETTKTDVTMRATFTFTTKSGIGFIFRAVDANNHWLAWADWNAQRLIVYEMVAGTLTEKYAREATFSSGAHQAILEVKDDWMRFELEDVAAITYAGMATGLTATQHGIRMFNTGHSIDDLTIELNDTTLPSVAATATNAGTPLTIPTYDGSGQAVHPSIIKVDEGWGNDSGGKAWIYWMAMTPFPNRNDALENPSILVSDDGTTWSVPPGLTNPIDPAPVAAINSDAELYLLDGTLYCVYRETDDAATYDKIWVQSTTDGITWGSPVEVLTAGRGELLSPTLLHDGTQWVMYVVNNLGEAYPHVEAWTCLTLTGTWTKNLLVDVPQPGGNEPWHLEVIRDDDGYYMILVDQQIGKETWFGASTDGLRWKVGDTALLQPGSTGAWDDFQTYRATMLRTETGFDLWYSAEDASQIWGIGRTTISY